MIKLTNPITGEYFTVAERDFDNTLTWYQAVTHCRNMGENWRLPLIEELNTMYDYMDEIGGFRDERYWSFTEFLDSEAKVCSFSRNIKNKERAEYFGCHKSIELKVRAVRTISFLEQAAMDEQDRILNQSTQAIEWEREKMDREEEARRIAHEQKIEEIDRIEQFEKEKLLRKQQEIDEKNQLENAKKKSKFHAGRAEAFIAMKQFSEAVDEFILAIELNPDDSSLRFKLGDNQMKIGQYRGAVESYTLGLQLNPEAAEVFPKLFEAEKLVERESEKRKKEFEKARLATIEHEKLIENKRIIDRMQAEFAEQEKIDEENRIKQEKIDEENRLKEAIEQTKRDKILGLEGQILELSKQIEENPLNVNFYFERAHLLNKVKRPQDALNDYSMISKLDPKSSKAFVYKAHVFCKMKDYKSAIVEYHSALKLSSTDDTIWEMLAQAYFNVGDHKGEVDAYEKAFLANSTETKYRIKKSDLCYSYGFFDIAITDYSRLIALLGKSAEVYYKLGKCELALQNEDAAFANFYEALTNDHNGIIEFKLMGEEKKTPLISRLFKESRKTLNVYFTLNFKKEEVGPITWNEVFEEGLNTYLAGLAVNFVVYRKSDGVDSRIDNSALDKLMNKMLLEVSRGKYKYYELKEVFHSRYV
jgi:tetratricopeptide (TPR) repeat protein